MLEVRDLHVSIEDTEILKGISLTVNEGEVHAIMGPNGSGKSTLANVVAGRPEYAVTSGEILYEGAEISEWFPEDRAREGIFLAMQYPVELPGVRTWQFLKAAVDAIREHKGES
ncbi:MAG: ATP-binding cassette domain-containing protein, partial [Dehalococcoidia bacterium]|nr:ATP-binding cassette domain-containing protein [Dehalococcoidia bacterium]